MSLSTPHYLIVPGWQGSPAEHWQSHWQRVLPNSARVEQDDWMRPRQADWVRRLEEAVTQAPGPVILIGHSLGCVTIAHWATQASPALLERVRGALLVAPADVERAECPQPLRNFAPLPRQPLPFPCLLVASDNDPAASASSALQLAADWYAEATLLSGVGHINVKSGHRRWEQGFAWLYRLQQRIDEHARRYA
jgi:predicted alpha/beta hydrolase family esterase